MLDALELQTKKVFS